MFRIILTVDKGGYGGDGQRRIQKKSRGIAKSTNIQEHPCRPYHQTREQADKPAENIKVERGINGTVYRRMYPMEEGSPKLYGLPKIHKAGSP